VRRQPHVSGQGILLRPSDTWSKQTREQFLTARFFARMQDNEERGQRSSGGIEYALTDERQTRVATKGSCNGRIIRGSEWLRQIVVAKPSGTRRNGNRPTLRANPGRAQEHSVAPVVVTDLRLICGAALFCCPPCPILNTATTAFDFARRRASRQH
jgi:hypothetical protein